MHDPRENEDEFQQIMSGNGYRIPQETVNESPYGGPVYSPKPGLTRRGKAAIAIGVTVIAGGSILTWQHYSAEADSNHIRAQELTLQQQQLELEKLKEMNKATAQNAKAQATQDEARQKQIDACINTNKSLVGKQVQATYSSVVNDCQNQYTGGSTDSDISEAASSTDTGGGGISPAGLVGIGAGAALLIAVAANRGKKTTAA